MVIIAVLHFQIPLVRSSVKEKENATSHLSHLSSLAFLCVFTMYHSSIMLLTFSWSNGVHRSGPILGMIIEANELLMANIN